MDAHDVIKAVDARGYIDLSAAEVDLLKAIADTDTRAASMLAAHAFNTFNHQDAISYATLVAERQPSATAEVGLVSAYVRAGQFEAAIERASRPGTPLSALQQATRLSEIYGQTGRLHKAIAWGRKALKLKDRSVAPKEAPSKPPVLHNFSPNKPTRNIISYSLFGARARYIDGAIRNTIVTRYLYPGWTPRFYIDDSVPKDAQTRLKTEGAQLRQVSNWPAHRYGLYWRFLVEDDPDVDLYIVRDADSVPNIKERACVAQWLASRHPFHIMRDGPTHSELILAGMWGAHRGNIESMATRIHAFEATKPRVLNSRVSDQDFLRQCIWPLMRGRMCCHDPVFEFGRTHTVGAAYGLPDGMRIGQNDPAIRHYKPG